MSTINNVSSSNVWGVQGNNQATQTQGTAKVHHHHHKHTDAQDSVQISEDGKQEAVNRPKGPLEGLVADGTITQDQEDAVRNAFMAARQAGKAGTYNSTAANPISSLVANNTITQAQADSITAAFKARVQGNENSQQAPGVHGGHRHHHHSSQQVQASVDPSQALLQTSESPDSIVNSILETAASQDTAAQSQEQTE